LQTNSAEELKSPTRTEDPPQPFSPDEGIIRGEQSTYLPATTMTNSSNTSLGMQTECTKKRRFPKQIARQTARLSADDLDKQSTS
jgi:hypothetical protein